MSFDITPIVTLSLPAGRQGFSKGENLMRTDILIVICVLREPQQDNKKSPANAGLFSINRNANYFTFTNSTSNSKVALAGITGG